MERDACWYVSSGSDIKNKPLNSADAALRLELESLSLSTVVNVPRALTICCRVRDKHTERRQQSKDA